MTSAKLRVLPVVHGCKTGSRRLVRLLKPPNLPICVIKLRKNIRCPRRIISRSQSSVPRHGRDAEKSGARQDICRGLWVFCIEMSLTPRLNVMKKTAAHFSAMVSIAINSRSTAALVLVSAMGFIHSFGNYPRLGNSHVSVSSSPRGTLCNFGTSSRRVADWPGCIEAPKPDCHNNLKTQPTAARADAGC